MKRYSWRIWGGLVLLVLAGIIIGPLLVQYSPTQVDTENAYQSPDQQHWLGTDHFGRDVLSRTLWGGRYSLASAALATLLALAISLIVGGVAGLSDGWPDWVLMRGVEVLLAFPGLLLALAFITILGTGLWQVVLAVGLALVPVYSRLVRAAVLSVREQGYVEAAYALGANSWWVLWRHLFPNAVGQIAAFMTVIFTWALLDVAALDFLGLTGSPSVPTWGRMLSEGREYLRVAPWIALGPGLLLTLSVLAATGLSDAWREGLPG